MYKTNRGCQVTSALVAVNTKLAVGHRIDSDHEVILVCLGGEGGSIKVSKALSQTYQPRTRAEKEIKRERES